MEFISVSRRRAGLLCGLFLLAISVNAQDFRIDASSDMGRSLRYAALEAGTLIATSASPYSTADVTETLQRIDTSVISDQARRLLAEFQVKAPFDYSLSLIPAFQAYLAKSGIYGTQESLGWKERLPLLSLPFEFSLASIVYGKTVLEIREDHNVIDNSPELAKPNVSNWIEDPSYIDWAFPFEAYVGAEYKQFSFTLGRDTLRWGPGKTGTLFISETPDYYDFLQASFIARTISYRFLWVTLDPTLLGSESPSAGNVVSWSKNLFVHRGEALFFNRIAFAVTEALVLGGKAPDISYLNPLLIFHNRWAWDANYIPYKAAASLFGVELRINPWRYIEAYGSFAMNQFQTSFENDRYGSASSVIPNAFAWLAGIEGVYPLWGGWLHLGYEAAYTNPWMYVRENQLNSFTWRRRLPTNVPGATIGYKDAPIGYKYGPDAMVHYVNLGFDAPGSLTIDLSFEQATRGEHTLYVPYEESAEAVLKTTPTGIPEITTTFCIDAEYYLVEGLAFSAGGRAGTIKNAGHIIGTDVSLLDFSMGVQYTLHLDPAISKLAAK